MSACFSVTAELCMAGHMISLMYVTERQISYMQGFAYCVRSIFSINFHRSDCFAETIFCYKKFMDHCHISLQICSTVPSAMQCVAVMRSPSIVTYSPLYKYRENSIMSASVIILSSNHKAKRRLHIYPLHRISLPFTIK